jgi:peptide/nickel transport system permease protein
MLDVLGQDYVRVARAKGLKERRVILHHAFRTALIPVVTLGGVAYAELLAGAVLTETIFSWPGIGKLTIDATREFDYPILMGVLLVTSVLVVLANLLADIAYGVVDPRIKY